MLILMFTVSICPLSSVFPPLNISAEEQPWIVSPKIGAPLSAQPSETIEIIVSSPTSPEKVKVWVRSFYTDERKLLLAGTSYKDGRLKISVKLPSDITPGLYDVIIDVRVDGDVYRLVERNSLYIYTTLSGAMRIVHVSDLLYDQKPENLRLLIDELNFLQVDLLVITGRLTSGDLAPYVEEIVETLGTAHFPIVVAPPPDYSEVFERWIAPPRSIIRIGNLYVYTLESKDGYIERDAMTWLKNALKGVGAEHFKIIATYPSVFAATKNFSWNMSERILYSSATEAWRSHQDLLNELLDLVRLYDIRLILGGSIGRDEVFSYYLRHHFVSSTSIVGGMDPDVPEGFRMMLIQVYPDPVVASFSMFGTPPSVRPHSTALDKVIVRYGPRNDGTTDAVTAIVENNLDTLVRGPLYFLLTTNYSRWAYTLYSPVTFPYEANSTARWNIFTVKVVVAPGKTLRVTIAREEDTEPPMIGEPLIEQIDNTIRIAVNVSDEGWGVETVRANLTLDGSSIGSYVMFPAGNESYVVEIAHPGEGMLGIVIVASDYALNTAISKQYTYNLASPTTTTAETTTPTTTSTTTTTTIPTGVSTSTPTPSPSTTPSPTTTSKTTTGGPLQPSYSQYIAIILIVAAAALGALLYIMRKRQPTSS